MRLHSSLSDLSKELVNPITRVCRGSSDERKKNMVMLGSLGKLGRCPQRRFLFCARSHKVDDAVTTHPLIESTLTLLQTSLSNSQAVSMSQDNGRAIGRRPAGIALFPLSLPLVARSRDTSAIL